eukprot:gene24651-10604_t
MAMSGRNNVVIAAWIAVGMVIGICLSSLQFKVETTQAKAEQPFVLSETHRKRGNAGLCLFLQSDNNTALYSGELKAVIDTWASNSTFFFSYEKLNIPKGSGHAVQLDPRRVHPDWAKIWENWHLPLTYVRKNEKTFYMWMWVKENLMDKCKWFMRLDTDTWVNVRNMERWLSTQHNYKEPKYIGAMATPNTDWHPSYYGNFGNGGT